MHRKSRGTDDEYDQSRSIFLKVPRDKVRHDLVRSGAPFEKTSPLKQTNRIHSDTRTKRHVIRDKENEEHGRAMEKKFGALCQEIISTKVFHWLISCKHAPRNEDIRHQTDFKLRVRHPDGYEFFMRFQVKSSTKYLHKYDNRPLKKGITLVIVSDRTEIFDIAPVLERVYYEEIRLEQERV